VDNSVCILFAGSLSGVAEKRNAVCLTNHQNKIVFKNKYLRYIPHSVSKSVCATTTCVVFVDDALRARQDFPWKSKCNARNGLFGGLESCDGSV
jgi:hypothetical protein